MEISENSRTALNALDELTPKERAVVAEVGGFMPSGDAPRTALIIILLGGLFVIAGIALWGGITTTTTKDAAPLYVIASAVVSGTLGLFIPSPVKK